MEYGRLQSNVMMLQVLWSAVLGEEQDLKPSPNDHTHHSNLYTTHFSLEHVALALHPQNTLVLATIP